MKEFWKEVGLAVVLGMLMPGIILNIVTCSARQHVNDIHVPKQTEPAQMEETAVTVLNEDGSIQKMELETYLTAVVLGEMPASFEKEALKAQAVVARTYTLRAEERNKHESGAICMDPSCCQAYCSAIDYRTEGGTTENIEKVRAAVAETAGMVLTYEGELIEATYFSCSGGMTEDALAVWGAEIPYLQAVPSPGEESSAYYTDSISFAHSDLLKKLGLPQADKVTFENIQYTAGGGVAEATVCMKQFQGTELRKLLGLRSTAFTVTDDGEQVTFHTRGFGHRVGMSQYGADAMAVAGCSYKEILQHYYPGTTLENRLIDKASSVG